MSVNRELIELYWSIGRDIVQRQQAEGWGKAVVDRIATDLQQEFPGIGGLSPSNIWRMRAFYLAWADKILARPVRETRKEDLAQAVRELPSKTVPQPVGQPPPQPATELPWGHNVVLIEKIKRTAERLWYAEQTIQHGCRLTCKVHCPPSSRSRPR